MFAPRALIFDCDGSRLMVSSRTERGRRQDHAGHDFGRGSCDLQALRGRESRPEPCFKRSAFAGRLRAAVGAAVESGRYNESTSSSFFPHQSS